MVQCDGTCTIKVWWHLFYWNIMYELIKGTVWWHWYKKCDDTYLHLKKKYSVMALVHNKRKVQCDGTGTKSVMALIYIWKKKYSVMALVHYVLEKKKSTVWWHWYKKCDGTCLHLKKGTVWWHWYMWKEKRVQCDGTGTQK